MKIKVCGLTSPSEAAYVNKNQVDFVGMVLFFPKSKRNIDILKAKEIMKALAPEIRPVAVVVAPSLEQVKEIEEAGFSYIQIHGAMPEGIHRETSIPVLKAFNVKDMRKYEAYHKDARIAGYVFDAQEPGSGKVFDWSLVKNLPRDEKLFFLAGGLHPGNVREAITWIHPDAVDVSSGVEYKDRPGKDPELIDEFVRAVRSISSV